MADKRQEAPAEKAAAKSRIVLEFKGPGSADLAGTQLINVTPGQVMMAAKWLDLQANQIYVQMQIEAQKSPILVPRGPLPGPM